MPRRPLHNRAADGRCEKCGKPFPCPTRLATYAALMRELEHPTPLAAAPKRKKPGRPRKYPPLGEVGGLIEPDPD